MGPVLFCSQYDWEGPSPMWEAAKSDFIDWRYTSPDVGNDTLVMDYVAEHNNETEHYDFFVHQVRPSHTSAGHCYYFVHQVRPSHTPQITDFLCTQVR